MDVALSKNGARLLRLFFVVVVGFLYAPIVILLIFSFNKSAVPTFPLSGFTLHWYRAFLANSEIRGALETSAIIAALSSAGAVVLGVLASIALTRRRFRIKPAVSALLLSPLVIPYVVFGISLLLLFHTLGVPRSLLTVVIGHIVISLPYTILVLVPRLDQDRQIAAIHYVHSELASGANQVAEIGIELGCAACYVELTHFRSAQKSKHLVDSRPCHHLRSRRPRVHMTVHA